MQIETFDIKGVVAITPKVFGDHRGSFSESFSKPKWREAGVDVDFVQDNESISFEAGVVRGLHFQAPPHAQAKLVRVVRGRVLDVLVDIRLGSPTYGRHVAVELSAENRKQLFAPVGMAHGFVTLEPNTEFHYKVSGLYAPETEGGLYWADPELGIDWPLDETKAILTDKDLALPRWEAFTSPFTYEERD